MKKAFSIVIVVCLAFGVAFAAKGAVKVGGQIGFGIENISMKKSPYGLNMSKNGFYLAATGEYGITNEILCKAEFGFATGASKHKTTVDGEEFSSSTYDAPINFFGYVGGEYSIEINKQINILAGAGLDFGFGKLADYYDDGDFRLGAAVEAAGVYNINKGLDVRLGARFAFYFLDSNSELKNVYDAYDNHSHFGLKIFAGCTYAF